MARQPKWCFFGTFKAEGDRPKFMYGTLRNTEIEAIMDAQARVAADPNSVYVAFPVTVRIDRSRLPKSAKGVKRVSRT